MREFKWSTSKFVETARGAGDEAFCHEAGESGWIDPLRREIGKAHDSTPLKQR